LALKAKFVPYFWKIIEFLKEIFVSKLTGQFHVFLSKIILPTYIWLTWYKNCRIGLHHPLHGVTNPEYKLLRFIQLTFFCKRKRPQAFNRDRCRRLALCLQLILIHWSFGIVLTIVDMGQLWKCDQNKNCDDKKLKETAMASIFL
jgi:hypothetical protein